MKVLVVGAKGMLGSDLVRSLGTAAQVIGTDIEDFDISNQQETLRALLEIKPRWVINAAAYTQVDRCEEERELAFKVNAHGVKHLALACRELQAKLLQVSTDYVFDGEKEHPYLEDDTPAPLSVYGHSKLKGESYVQDLLGDFIIVRTGGLYGRAGVNFVNTIIRAAKERDELKVVNDQWVSPTYTVDLCSAIQALVTTSPQGIFHVTNSDRCTWYQFACRIVELTGSKSKVIPIMSSELKRPAKRPGFSVLNCGKFTKTTGMKLRVWDEALAEYLSLGERG